MPRRRGRRINRANRAPVPTTAGTPSTALVPKPPSVQRTTRSRPVARRRNRRRSGLATLTPGGLAFLKCAFASPDFATDPGTGIPDAYSQRTLTDKYSLTSNMTFTPGTDTYIVIAPVPGIAYFKCETNIGDTPHKFVATTYPSGIGVTNAFDCTKFRYASQSVGLYSTSNMGQFGGSVSVYKPPAAIVTQSYTEPPSTGVVSAVIVRGLDSIGPAIPRDSTTWSFALGAYSNATQPGDGFPWTQINTTTQISNSATIDDAATSVRLFERADNKRMMGWGSVETIVILVTTPKGCVNAASLKNWACVEYEIENNSQYYSFVHPSPPADPIAMLAYKRLCASIPLAVVAAENAHAWDRISKTLMVILKALSNVPGPIGLGSGGAATLVEALRSVTI